jgi:SAM-dependent methyltransferase
MSKSCKQIMFLLYFIFFILIFSVLWSTISLAPWVPTRNKDLERIKKLANIKKGEIFYELGCGTGRVSRYINKQTKEAVYGIELSILLWLYCQLSKLVTARKNLFFKLNNIYNENLSKADVVYFFGHPRSMKELKQKLTADLKKGTRIVSYTFKIEGWEPIVISKPNKDDLPIYLYKI